MLYSVTNGSSDSGVTNLLVERAVQPDTAIYIERFAASTLFLGVLPLAALRLSRLPLRTVGFARPRRFGTPVWLIGISLGGALAGALVSLNPEVAAYYPFHPRLGELVYSRGEWMGLLHSAAYFVTYYLPWEIAFRGVLVVAVTDIFIRDRDNVPQVAVLIALLHVAPSALLHSGHPVSEIVGAVVFGIGAAYVTVVSRSIFPALIFHAAAGIALDWTIIMRFPS